MKYGLPHSRDSGGQLATLCGGVSPGSGGGVWRSDKATPLAWTSIVRAIALTLACGMLIGCSDAPTEGGTDDGVSPADLTFALRAVEETAAIIALGVNVFGVNPAILGLQATGAQLVSAAEQFTEFTGRTFVWDSAAARYQPDDARGDAPFDGIRFVLYDTDSVPLSRTLRFPLTETGYVDVVSSGGEHHVTMVTRGATVLDYFSSGAIDGNDSIPCCQYAVLGAFPRNLAAAGTYQVGDVAGSFSYADTIDGSAEWEGIWFREAHVYEIRSLHVLLPDLGTLQFRSGAGASIRWADSDTFVELRVTLPARDGNDSIAVNIGLDGFRENLYLDSFTIDGQEDVLTFNRGFLYRGEPIDAPQLRLLTQVLRSSSFFLVRSAYLPFGSLEATVAPAIFCVALNGDC